MCDHPPVTADPQENYYLDNSLRTVGQIVTAYCKNTTVAIVQCMPDLTWNATIPSCPFKESSTQNMATLLVILWVVGAILLFSLIILIAVIITTKSKTRCGGADRNGSPSTSIFHISGRGNARSRGGDNPAFSRADEICGEWSYHRGDRIPESQRLPSYQEAILNNYITVPARPGNGSHQDLHALPGVTDEPGYQNSQVQRQDSDSIPGGSSQIRTARSDSVTHHIAEEQSTETNHRHEPQDSALCSTIEPMGSIDQTDSSANQRTTRQDTSFTSRRYAENYPQCFFEDEPPPPYSLRHASSTVHRSSHPNQQTQRSYRPSRRRSIHAVPCSRTNEAENDPQNSHFRRSMYDRWTTSPNPEEQASTPRINGHIHPSAESCITAEIYSRRHETTLDTRTNIETNQPLPATFTSDVNHANDSSLANHMSRHLNTIGKHITNDISRGSHMSRHSNSIGRHTVNQAPNLIPQVSNSTTSSNALYSDPSASPVPSSSVSTIHQGYVSRITLGCNSIRKITENSRAGNHETSSAPGVFQIAPSAPPYLPITSSSRPNHNETQPLGTSTPISQSPVEIRRFVPVNHPSPLSIPHKQPLRHPSQNQFLPSLPNYGIDFDRSSATFNHKDQYVPSRMFADRHHNHVAHQSAPLARFDCDYTYL